jgi:hypothetical protein
MCKSDQERGPGTAEEDAAAALKMPRRRFIDAFRPVQAAPHGLALAACLQRERLLSIDDWHVNERNFRFACEL